MKITLVLALALLCALPAFAFDETRARGILDTLTSEIFAGRRPGTEGAAEAEYYLAKKLSDYRVYQGGLSSYFQDVPLQVTEDRGSRLTLLDHPLGKIPFLSGVDFTVVTGSGSATRTLPVTIAGFGYVRPDKDRNDYDSVDVKGQAVVVLRDTPASPYDFTEDLSRRFTLQWAKERGAAAVLFYQDPEPVRGAAIPAELYDANIPLLYVGDRLLRLLLDGTGYSLETYKAKLKTAPLPLETHKRLQIATKVRRKDDITPRNVLGIIYGTDPQLKHEVIVVGAHHDHLGTDAQGVIYPGADDDASGSAIASELARSLIQKPPRRSVLIIHFTGEEEGLAGSDYFVKHSTIPLRNIVGMVNLDMEGMGAGNVVMAGGELWGPVFREYRDGLDSLTRAKLIFSREDGHGGSDHANFMNAGIPTLAFWSRGDHPFYHSYNDEARWISDSALAAVGNRAEDFIRFVANRSGTLVSYADTARVLGRLATTINFIGLTVASDGQVPALSAITAAWLPPEAAPSLADVVKRTTELHAACALNDISSLNLKDAFAAWRRHHGAMVLGMDEADLARYRPADVGTLMREGLSILRLANGSAEAADKAAPSATIAEARTAGIYALVPFDFGAAARVEQWKDHAIISASFHDFAAAPESVRHGLLLSDALLVLEVNEVPTPEQIAAISAGRARRVHLSFGFIPQERREEHARLVMQGLLKAGISREEILLLTGGNLRRFFSL